MSASNAKQLEFPIWIKGTIDGKAVNIPFISGGDVQHYLESLDWATNRYLLSIDLTIYTYGEEVQKIQFKPKGH